MERFSAHKVQRLRATLPLVAHAKPALLASLRKQASGGSIPPRVLVTNVFDSGCNRGVMCQIVTIDPICGERIIVAPISQIAFPRKLLFPIEIEPRTNCSTRRRRNR